MEPSRTALFLLDCMDPEAIHKTLATVAPDVVERLEEIVVVHERPVRAGEAAPEAGSLAGPEVRVLHAPRPLGYGGSRKAAFEYAVARGFDHVITMSGDGRHPPELLRPLLDASAHAPHALVLASRSHLPLPRRLAGTALNRLLALGLRDHQTGFRVLPVPALACVPYQLCSSGQRFDDHNLIQLRALDAAVVEVPTEARWQESRGADGPFGAVVSALDYRGHQLHWSRRHRYIVDEGTHYTLKLSPTGSHMQIVDAIAAGSQVLDLGCSQGLLARPLSEKGVRVTGVDLASGHGIADELHAYYSRDLELPLDLPTARDFDYVVLADVIEHVQNRAQLLRGARRFLKPGGRLIISTPNIAIWFYRLSLLVGRFEYGPRGVLDETHVHLYTGATFRREVENAGFHILEQRVTALPFEVVFQSTGRSRAVRALADFYHALARLWPSMFAYQHILEAEITTLDEDASE